MAIDNKFLLFAKTSTFEAKLNGGEINDDSIVFIKDKGQIYTHGHFYSDLSQITELSGIVAGLTAADIAFAASGTLEATDVKNAIIELAGKISSTQEDAKSYSMVAVTEGLGANVKEAFQLKQTVNGVTTNAGSQINIYKDSAVQSASMGKMDSVVDASGVITTPSDSTAADAICICYLTAEGGYDLVKVNVADYLRETEFGDGLQIVSGQVSIKINETSKDVLVVTEDGIELTGVVISADFDSLSGQVDAISGSLNDLTGEVGTLSEELSGFVNDTYYNIDVLSGSIESLSGSIESLSGELESTTQSLSGSIESLSGVVDGIVLDLSGFTLTQFENAELALTGAIGSNAEDIATLSGTVYALQSTLSWYIEEELTEPTE